MSKDQEAMEKAFENWYQSQPLREVWEIAARALGERNQKITIQVGFEGAYALQESRFRVVVKALQDVSDNYDPTNPEKMIQEIRAALKEIGASNE